MQLKLYAVSVTVYSLHGKNIGDLMRLFIKEHQNLIFLQLFQFFVMGSLIWLGGFRNLSLILYTIFLGLFFLFVYLVYKFVKQKQLYERLSKGIESVDESQQNLGYDPLSESVTDLLRAQYQLYEREIWELKDKQEQHYIFMDRWIHQMKTPVSVLELMAEELDEPEASDMREEVERLKTGLQTVLHMARLRTIERDFHVKKVDLYELLLEVNQENKRLFIRNKVYPKLEVAVDEAVVESDEKWLHFMITQLIHNAVKYSAEKSDEILLKVYQRGRNLVLEVEDFGIGIDSSDIKRIFDRFYTGETGRKYRESTGVGLYLVKKVADHLGHGIEVESKLGEGTKIRVIF